jgi:hypothetical protein
VWYYTVDSWGPGCGLSRYVYTTVLLLTISLFHYLFSFPLLPLFLFSLQLLPLISFSLSLSISVFCHDTLSLSFSGHEFLQHPWHTIPYTPPPPPSHVFPLHTHTSNYGLGMYEPTLLAPGGVERTYYPKNTSCHIGGPGNPFSNSESCDLSRDVT